MIDAFVIGYAAGPQDPVTFAHSVRDDSGTSCVTSGGGFPEAVVARWV
ncbi:hypothetical protein [Streptomyces gibsoniae]|uniref:Uncharacterized protein n=1 Tax=Streptomyces gibsoniae TaxID=3075529 RepID=A0ABU2TWS1_9ACTN|nr:hypothetical protein [Streptomyces sp. DSM 41699]MDT0465403.1 hypothetical protein [Streptomyces sp. DSM 41699]